MEWVLRSNKNKTNIRTSCCTRRRAGLLERVPLVVPRVIRLLLRKYELFFIRGTVVLGAMERSNRLVPLE